MYRPATLRPAVRRDSFFCLFVAVGRQTSLKGKFAQFPYTRGDTWSNSNRKKVEIETIYLCFCYLFCYDLKFPEEASPPQHSKYWPHGYLIGCVLHPGQSYSCAWKHCSECGDVSETVRLLSLVEHLANDVELLQLDSYGCLGQAESNSLSLVWHVLRRFGGCADVHKGMF